MPVALGQLVLGRRPAAARAVGQGLHAARLPGVRDRIDPPPGRLLLVALDEQGRVVVQRVEDQLLVGDAPPRLAVLGQAEVQRQLLQRHPLLGQAGALVHDLERDALLRLEHDHQLVGIGVPREDGVRHLAEADDDLRLALGQPLAGLQVEGHARPAPVLDLGADGDVALGRALGVADVLGVGRGLLAVRAVAFGVLAPDRARLDVLRRDARQAAQHLDLLVAHRLRVEARGRLHRDEAQELEEVILHHVADGAVLVVVPPAPLRADGLGDRDLHALDGLRVPQRLEDAVREAQRDEVLDGLLAEVVVDAERPVLGEGLRDRVVDLDVGGEVVADRLLDHDAVGRAGQAHRLQVRADGAEDGRARGEIEHHLVRAAAFEMRAQPLEVVPRVRVHADIGDARGEAVEGRLVEAVADALGDPAAHGLAEVLVRPVRPRGADDALPVRQEALRVEVVEAREQHPAREIAGRAEEDEGAGRGHDSDPTSRSVLAARIALAPHPVSP